MASPEEGPEPLKYQTWVLKVSIHCEGCKKKVKKVLHSIEGVYKITIDLQQQKVVVTGNVEGDALVKKLLKTGKHAELWPEANPIGGGGGGGGGGGKKKKSKSKNKNKSDGGGGGGNPNEAPPENPDNHQSSSCGGDESADESEKPGGEEPPKNGGKESQSPKPNKKDGNGNGNSNSNGSSPPPQAKPEGGDKPAAAAAGGGGGGGKKKGKKGNKENGTNGNGGGVELAPDEMGIKPMGIGGGAAATNFPAFNYPSYSNIQIPSYVVSYSAVQPSMSYGGAYHPTPVQQSSYYYSTVPPVSASPGSYYLFSEENANACKIM